MCRIIWQCTLTPPQPSTAAMAGMLNTPAAEAHPPVTSSVQLRSKLAQSGRRSSGIYWAAQANITIHAHIEIIFFVPSATASVSARESGRLEIAGAACFILITAALSGRIWTVNVTGCETVPEEDIRETVERFGVYPGMRKKQLDTHTVAEEAMSALPDVSWLSVNIVGCSVNVDVREGVGKSVKKK